MRPSVACCAREPAPKRPLLWMICYCTSISFQCNTIELLQILATKRCEVNQLRFQDFQQKECLWEFNGYFHISTKRFSARFYHLTQSVRTKSIKWIYSFPTRRAHLYLHHHSFCLPQHDLIKTSSAHNACCLFYFTMNCFVGFFYSSMQLDGVVSTCSSFCSTFIHCWCSLT